MGYTNGCDISRTLRRNDIYYVYKVYITYHPHPLVFQAPEKAPH